MISNNYYEWKLFSLEVFVPPVYETFIFFLLSLNLLEIEL